MNLDPASLIQAALLAITCWGLVRFVAQVDRLEKRVDDCCGLTHARKKRRRTDNRT